jgi:hypothetical protein
MIRSGAVKMLKRRAWPRKLLLEGILWHPVDFSSIFPIFAVLGAGFVVSGLVLTVEVLVARQCRRS